uniref:DUF3791 domain-containing protein n=1 Tax=uncultured bacterium contig00092 TaxID=1181563 RepID=A0A806K2Y3_9BACT|nr:hypothetical protein [uncultured bacterium contig00092]
MTNVEKYTIFLIEQYRSKFGISASIAYNLFKDKGILEYINNTFEAIHTLDTDFVISEIEELVNSA